MNDMPMRVRTDQLQPGDRLATPAQLYVQATFPRSNGATMGTMVVLYHRANNAEWSRTIVANDETWEVIR